MQISHRERVQLVEFKHYKQPPSPDERVLQILDCLRSGKEEPDQREENQGASDGRTEN